LPNLSPQRDEKNVTNWAKWQIMQTGENSIIEALIFYHSNSYT